MSPGEGRSFDPTEFTPEKTLARIAEMRAHLGDELMTEAAKREDAVFVTPFLTYLNMQASRFEQFVDAPLDLLAFVTRNLLEFSVLLRVVFRSQESKALFLNETFRLDTRDLQTRVSQMFAEIGTSPPPRATLEDMDWLPAANTGLAAKRDVFDSWFHKFCSKLMHPTAIMIVAPEALADPAKRATLCFAGLQYLGQSYNFLVDQIFAD